MGQVIRAHISAALLVILAAACNGSPAIRPHAGPLPATLRVALGGVPASLDPVLQRDPWERALASLYSEPLLQPNADLSDVEPAAALSYDASPDGLTYTFHLRPDGRFADGRPVTAGDFVTAWKRIIDPRTASPHADLFASIVAGGAYAEALDPEDPAAPIDAAMAKVGLAAPDPLTFQVTLAHPGLALKWVATVWAGAPAGNGPFRIASVADGAVTLLPNTHYRVRPRLRKVIAYEEGGAEAVAAFRAGGLDIAPVPLAEAGQAAADPKLSKRVLKIPELATDWIVFNSFRAPFGQASLRQAVSAALDRQAYVSGPLEGQGEPAVQVLPAALPERLPGPQGLEAYDPAGARALLGRSAGALGKAHLLVEDTPSGRALGDFVRAQLHANLGVGISVDAVDAKTYAQRIGNRQFDMAGPQRWLADDADPEGILDQFTTGSGANVGRWQDPLFDQLVGLGDSTLDAAARHRAYTQAQLELNSQAPAAFLDHPTEWVLVSPRLQNLAPGPGSPLPLVGTFALAQVAITS